MSSVHWECARPSAQIPDAAARAVWVENATLTAFRTGRIPAPGRVWHWATGAVHDGEGRLVPASQRLWQGESPQPAPADPERVRIRNHERRLDGRWVYAGHWTRHFGHFLVETLTNLWPPEAGDVDGIVATRSAYTGAPAVGGRGMSPADLHPWQSELLALAGFADHDVQICRHKPVQVQRLLVPERPVFLKHWVRPEAVDLWRRMGDAVGERGTSSKVFFSRSRFNAEHGVSASGALRTESSWDELLDRSFAAAGFEVVRPEEHPVADQIAIVRGADILAGSSGSALHLSCFADPGTKVLEIGDSRSRDRRRSTQHAIDAACGHRTAHLPYGDTEALKALPALTEAE